MDLRVEPADGYSPANVDVLSLDYLCEERKLVPDLIKLDVEGYEAPIFRGAEKLFESRKPAMLYELHKDAKLARHHASRLSVTREILRHGYSLFALNEHRGQNVSERPLIAVRQLDHPVLAIQRSTAFVAVAPSQRWLIDDLVASR
jgi:hypothetical protein